MANLVLTETQDLIPSFLNGDRHAVGIVDGWIDAVLRREFHSLHSDWDDLKQEVRIRLITFLRANHFEEKSAFRTFVNRVTRNIGIDCTRKAYRHRETTVGAKDTELQAVAPEDSASKLAERELLARILERSTERDRAVVDLVFFQHLSYAEASERLGISEGAFKVLVFRCKDRLLRTMKRLQRSGESRC